MTEQKMIKIGDIDIPIIVEDGVKYYPIRSLCLFILKRTYLCPLRELETIYQKHIRIFDLRYTEKQPKKSTRCIVENGLIEVLVKTNISKLSNIKIDNQNILHKYLGIYLIHESEKSEETVGKGKGKILIRWNKAKVTKEILKRYKKEQSLGSNLVQKEFRSLHDAGCNHFGSWENAVISSGIDYDEVREDRELMHLYGHKFEKVLKEILNEIFDEKDITKGYDTFLRPDFVICKVLWIDAKLSEWTASIPTTIEKYEPYCKSLTIVYLRGNRKGDKKVTGKTRLVSVYKYINQLSDDRKNYYIHILNELYIDANNQDLKIKNAAKK